MTSIVLVPSPVTSEQKDGIEPESYIPLGLLSIATILKAEGWKIDIVDTKQLTNSSIDEVVSKHILDKSPTIIGFSTMCNSYVTTVNLARACKLARPDVIVVFGGPQATLVCDTTLSAFPFVDYVVRGECEQSIASFIKALDEGRSPEDIPGISFRQGETIIQTPLSPDMADLNQTPIPDYELYPGFKLLDGLPIEAGRGCPFECSFCSTSHFWHRKYRMRSTARLIATITELCSRHSIRSFAFQHDNLTASRQSVVDLCTGIKEAKLNIRWSCSSRVDSLDAELIQMLASAGCNHIYLGIESGSPRIQKLIRKNLDLQRAVETVKLISEAGIEFTASFIMGFPEETMSDLLKTVDLMLSLRYAGTGNESIQLHLLAPAPGTLLHHNNRLNLRFDGRFSDIALPNLLPDDLELITRHPDVFSAYYYYDTPNIERTDLLCLHHFLTTLNVLPYTTYVLWKDERFHFPTMFFEHIDAIHLAEDERFDPTSITDVSAFITQTLRTAGLTNHFIHDVLAYEVAASRVSTTIEGSVGPVVQRFEYDVEKFISQISNREIIAIPDKLERDEHSLMFLKKDGQLSTVRLNAQLAGLFR